MTQSKEQVSESIKAKGDELIKTFLPWVAMGNTPQRLAKMNAKAVNCAIIAVEEIMPLAKGCDFGISGIIAREEGFMTNEEYWNSVLNYLKSKL